MKEPPLTGRVALVTGGGRGLGRAHALALAEAGARVLVSDLGCDVHGDGEDPSVALEVTEAIEKAGGEAVADHTDLSTSGGMGKVVARTLSVFGRLDVVVGCAGVVVDRSVLKMDDALLDRAIALHIRGSFALTRLAARAMIDGGHGGSIVLHTAPVAFFGAVRQSALAATQAAVVGLVRCAAIELRKHGIRVNGIAPTARTRTTEELPLFKGIDPKSMGPETVSPVVVHLASEAASAVTGEIVGVAGSRVYSLGGRETPGWFAPASPAEVDQLREAWPEVTRP